MRPRGFCLIEGPCALTDPALRAILGRLGIHSRRGISLGEAGFLHRETITGNLPVQAAESRM